MQLRVRWSFYSSDLSEAAGSCIAQTVPHTDEDAEVGDCIESTGVDVSVGFLLYFFLLSLRLLLAEFLFRAACIRVSRFVTEDGLING